MNDNASKDSDSSIKILYLNARSICNKLPALELNVAEIDPDLIIITESWCNDKISDAFLSIKNFSVEIRIDRTDTAHGIGGGILVYAKNTIKIDRLDCDSDFIQYCMFDVCSKNSSSSMTILAFYRSPNSTEENNDKLCKLVENLSDKHFNIVIGDLNFPNINWTEGTFDNKSKTFIETCDNKFLSQLVTFPTHIHGNTLDVILSNISDRFIDIQNLGNLSNSDHCMILSEIAFEPAFNSTDQYIYDWKNADIDALSNFFRRDWTEILKGQNVEEDWTALTSCLDEALDKFVPRIRRRQNNRPPWMTRRSLQLSRRKQRLWKCYVNNGKLQEDLVRYKKALKQSKKCIQKDKRSYEKKIANCDNQKPFNAYLKNKVKSRTRIGPLKVDGVKISDNLGMANELNNFFCSVFTNENLVEIPSFETLEGHSFLDHVEFTPCAVFKKIKSLKQSSSSGPDNISVKFLKDFASELSHPLSMIFKTSLQNSTVPLAWKQGNITPIFKKGSRNSVGNYRPVSLTSVPCRIMESIIKDHIIKHLDDNNLVVPTQHGFVKKRSTVTNLLEFFEKVTSKVDSNQPMDLIYLDFSKAFDKVPRERLLIKLEAHRITGSVLGWARDWLSGRNQRVVINGAQSDWADVHSGVPQGSVLGPLFFIIFLNNDFDKLCETLTVMNKFADDSKLGNIAVSESDRENLQNCLNHLYKWTDKWGMQFNIDKCKVIHSGFSNPLYSYTINGQTLDSVENEKDLGVMMQKTLKPGLQCKQMARRANGILGQICRAFHFRDRHVFIKLYKRYVRVHLEYSSPAWSPWQSGDIEILERVQRRAVRMVSGLKGNSYEEKLNELGLDTLQNRRTRADMIQTFKILKGVDNVDPSIWFCTVENNTSIQTRRSAYPLNLQHQRSNLEIRRNFFSIRVAEPWNSLPIEVKDAEKIEQFKKLYDDHISSRRK